MCRHCLLTPLPDRSRFCSDSGALLSNFRGCAQCKQGDRTKVKTKNSVREDNSATEVEDGEYEEEVTFDHVCGECDHVISSHYYSFRIVRGENASSSAGSASSAAASSNVSLSPPPVAAVTQEYMMECTLCGKGTDEHVINRATDAAKTENEATVTAADAASSSSAETAAAAPSFSLAAIQVRNPQADGAAAQEAKAKEDEEWA